jgi:NosR/NirI family nitrous oxide reductase transcriptional regulator
VVRTSPHTDAIIGYRGWTDTLIAFDDSLKVVGVRIRSSQDTREHVGDVKGDPYFMKTWNGKPWEEVARKTPQQAGIEGVSGASMTSMAVAEAIQRRLEVADSALRIVPAYRFGAHDVGLVAIVIAGVFMAFAKIHGRQWLRWGFQALVIVYVGFVTGDLLSQSIIAGWTANGAPWRTAPGLVLLLAAALAVPWTTRKPLYCMHLCPHGAAQELLSHLAPKRWRVALPKDFAKGLRWLPPLLLALVVIVTILVLPIDLAGIEPFDAYLIHAAGWATISIAVAGLVASLFVPMAYCHFGCPTGALLNFIRARGSADHFGRRDIAAAALVALAAALSWKYQAIHFLLTGGRY